MRASSPKALPNVFHVRPVAQECSQFGPEDGVVIGEQDTDRFHELSLIDARGGAGVILGFDAWTSASQAPR